MTSARRRSAKRFLQPPSKFMPRAPRRPGAEAEAMLLKAGFVWLRSKGSHRIYAKGGRKVVVPFHGGANLHPKIVEPVFESMKKALESGDRIELRGFGVFNVKPRKTGIGRNPRTGAEVSIPPGKAVRFKPGKELQTLQ